MINVCTKNLAFQKEQGNLWNCLKTFASCMLTMEEGNLWSQNSSSAHTVKEQFAPEENRDIASFKRTTSSTVQSTRRTLTSTFQDYRIRQWNDHMASTFKIWFRRSRTTLSDKHFKMIFNNIDNSILSAKNHKTWLKQLETLHCVNYSMLNPKHNAKHVWRTGTSASSAARAVTSYEMILQWTRSTSSQFLTSSLFRTTTSGRADHMVTGTERKKVIKNITLRINSNRSAGNDNSWTFTIDSFVTHGMEDAHKLLKIPKSECPDIWIRLPRHKWPKSWSNMEDPVVPLERNLYGHPLEGLLWERKFEQILLKHGWEKIPNWECLFVHREKGLFLSVYVDDKKIGWKETKSWSDVESTQQRSRFGRTNIFPWSCILGMHSTTMLNKRDIVDNHRTMFESQFPRGE